jgi:two-component system OmpR family response regulator
MRRRFRGTAPGSPAGQDPIASLVHPRLTAQDRRGILGRGSVMRILVVEDYPILRDGMVEGLQRQGFAVDASGDGDEGLWYATSNDYDLIILDLMLPGKDGLAILKAVRASGRDMPVLIITAKDGVDDRVHGLDLGADDYLVKPFALAELFARVRSMTRRRYGKRNPAIVIGDLTIDTVARTVRRGDRPVELTQREFALLEVLALRQGETLTRSEIAEHIYDFADASMSNVIDATMLRLRRKIDRPGLPALLQTRRGFGYVLALPETP